MWDAFVSCKVRQTVAFLLKVKHNTVLEWHHAEQQGLKKFILVSRLERHVFLMSLSEFAPHRDKPSSYDDLYMPSKGSIEAVRGFLG